MGYQKKRCPQSKRYTLGSETRQRLREEKKEEQKAREKSLKELEKALFVRKTATYLRDINPVSERWADQYFKLFGILSKFDKNAEFNGYIPDYLCLELKIIIEIDDSSHNFKKAHDAKRDAYFSSLGYTTHRVKYKDEDGLKKILASVSNKLL